MFKRIFTRPAHLRPFRDPNSRGLSATLFVLVLSVAAAALLVSVLRHPAG